MSDKERRKEKAKSRRLALAAAVAALGASVGVQAADLPVYPISQPAQKEGQTAVAVPGAEQLKLRSPAASQGKWAPGGSTQGKHIAPQIKEAVDGAAQLKDAGVR